MAWRLELGGLLRSLPTKPFCGFIFHFIESSSITAVQYGSLFLMSLLSCIVSTLLLLKSSSDGMNQDGNLLWQDQKAVLLCHKTDA